MWLPRVTPLRMHGPRLLPEPGCRCRIQVPPLNVVVFSLSVVMESFFHFHTQSWRSGGLAGLVMQFVVFDNDVGGKSW